MTVPVGDANDLPGPFANLIHHGGLSRSLLKTLVLPLRVVECFKGLSDEIPENKDSRPLIRPSYQAARAAALQRAADGAGLLLPAVS